MGSHQSGKFVLRVELGFFYHHFHKKFPADSIVVIVSLNVELEQSNRPINQLVVIYGAKQPQQIALPVCLSIRT